MNNSTEWEWANDIAPIRPDYISNDYLQLMWLNISDFDWKKVTSIWGWFWILEIELAKTWKTIVEIVDPIFRDKTQIDKIIQDTYDKFYGIEKERRDYYYWYSSFLKKETQNKIYKLFSKFFSLFFENI